MRNTIIIALISLAILGCGKDKFTTKPQMKFKEVNSTFIPRFAVVEFRLSFTDLEGDLPGKLFVQRLSNYCAADTFFVDSLMLPEFPTSRNTEGELVVSYSNGNTFGQKPMSDVPSICDDTTVCYFKFVLKDKAGNISDTARSPEIAISKF